MAIIIHNVYGGFGERTKSIIIPTEEPKSMKATEARELADEAQLIDMSAIYTEINNLARKGHEAMSIDIEKWKHKASVDKVTTELKANGYKVSRNKGHDQRDGDSWDQLNISW